MLRRKITAAALVSRLGAAAGLAMVALPAVAEITAPRAQALEHMVIQDCGSCHGLTMKGGLGNPLTAAALDGAAPEALASIILDGVPGTAMPPWRPLLTEEEADWIANYLLKDKK
ncbi:c-type cytochrome [Pseudorhodobacter sp.]|uniref:c-type cytochrome n=1 Tax=Pseudorhodobacter sp. TaxID=1934400 RepID=UPI0039E39C26